MSQNKIGIIGCGWLGLPLAKEFVSNNYKVKGSTTTKEKLEILKNEGIDAYLIDVGEFWVRFFLGLILLFAVLLDRAREYFTSKNSIVS